jgi:hypothetical protein
MSIILDRQFIDIAGRNLRNFKWKKEGLANCSCPICGDSKRDKKKARGYFYSKHGKFFYKCHNCEYWASLSKFLNDVDHNLYKEYHIQMWMQSPNYINNKRQKGEKEMFGLKSSKPKFKDKMLKGCKCLKDLPKDHPAAQFADLRIIPKQHWDKLYFTENFGDLAANLDPEQKLFKYDPRLVIPFYNKEGGVVAVQGRALSMKAENEARKTVKYITVKADKSIERLWYGMWRANPNKRVYVVEGPIDSLFLNNAVAMVGAGSANNIPSRFAGSDLVFALDNEPRNRQIVKFNQNLIDAGHKVCIWPKTMDKKDINDMAYDMSVRDIQKMIDKNTYSGLEASLRLKEWSV